MITKFTVFNLFFAFVAGEVYRWCDPHETFCLFSFGANVTVSNLEEAQLLCKEAKYDSKLLKIISSDIYDTAEYFKNDVSLMKDIDVLVDHGSFTKYVVVDSVFRMMTESNNDRYKYGVICQTDCFAQWTVSNKGFDKNKEKCTHECETHKSKDCIGVETYSRFEDPCWFYTTNNFLPNPSEFEGEGLYIINRAMKTIENCVGNLSGPNPTNRVGIISVIFMGFMVLAISLLYIVHKRKYYKREIKGLSPGIDETNNNGQQHIYNNIGNIDEHYVSLTDAPNEGVYSNLSKCHL